MDDELGPVPDEIVLEMAADEMCRETAWENECVRRVPELTDVKDDCEFHRWQRFLAELDEMDASAKTSDLAECAYRLTETGRGWIEDDHGGAVYVPYC